MRDAKNRGVSSGKLVSMYKSSMQDARSPQPQAGVNAVQYDEGEMCTTKQCPRLAIADRRTFHVPAAQARQVNMRDDRHRGVSSAKLVSTCKSTAQDARSLKPQAGVDPEQYHESEQRATKQCLRLASSGRRTVHVPAAQATQVTEVGLQ